MNGIVYDSVLCISILIISGMLDCYFIYVLVLHETMLFGTMWNTLVTWKASWSGKGKEIIADVAYQDVYL